VDNIKEKENATKEAGYHYEIWIYDWKGKKVVIE
jgi:LAS superfamily LD-carboxypeptidase LdcB